MRVRTYNNREVERILLNNGWRVHRQKGSHKTWHNDKGDSLTLGGVKYNKMVVRRLIKEYGLKVD